MSGGRERGQGRRKIRMEQAKRIVLLALESKVWVASFPDPAQLSISLRTRLRYGCIGWSTCLCDRK